MTRQNRTTNLSVLLLLLVIVLCASYLLRMDNQVPQLEYSQVRQLFEQEKVESVTFPDEHTVELHLREKVKSLGGYRHRPLSDLRLRALLRRSQ